MPANWRSCCIRAASGDTCLGRFSALGRSTAAFFQAAFPADVGAVGLEPELPGFAGLAGSFFLCCVATRNAARLVAAEVLVERDDFAFTVAIVKTLA